jgi:catechol 2,3-dioxygenase-like lactoylglutathione lyase family enzyme
MFQGLKTLIYNVDNLDEAKDWYSSVLGVKPYFDEPYYVGFSVGGFEFGLDPDMSDVSKGNNAVAYDQLVGLGATSIVAPHDVGSGIKVSTLADPFGNTIGIIENPNE